MKAIKTYMIFSLLLILIFCSLTIIQADTINNNVKAEELKQLGLIQGTGSGFNLEKAFTRAEGAVIIIRLSGMEKKALAYTEKAVFKDVQKEHWAEKYVSYAYNNNIVKGISSEKYGPEGLMTGDQFVTFVLRVLGYPEAKPETAFPLAVQSGLLSVKRAKELTDKKVFLRDDMVEVAHNALCTKVNKSSKTLLQKLVEDKQVVSKEAAIKSGLYTESSLMDKIDDAIAEKLKNSSSAGK